MNLVARYRQLREAAQLSESRANEIVQEARPYAAALLTPTGLDADALDVTARRVEAADAIGGSLIPAWPIRHEGTRVTIEFVDDWGAVLAGWEDAASESGDPSLDIHALIGNGDRLWMGIANDVLQMYVPNPPDDTYSMVRHHALMLGAAAVWMGAERASRWKRAHAVAGRAFLGRLNGRPLWDGVASAEQGLKSLLADPRSKAPAEAALGWLDSDRAAADLYRSFHGAASLGIAALLASAPDDADLTGWLRDLIHQDHTHPDFNRDRIEAFAQAAGVA